MSCEIRKPLINSFLSWMRGFSLISSKYTWLMENIIYGGSTDDREERVRSILREAQDQGAEKLKAVINEENRYGDNALMLAARDGHERIVKILLEYGAYKNRRNVEDNTALILAVEKGNAKIVDLLLTSGAEINIQNKNGVTALMLAASRGYEEIVRILLNNGADLDIKNADNETALLIAVCSRHGNIAKILVEYGADVNASNSYKETALIFAARMGDEEIVEFLLENYADVCVYACRPGASDNEGISGTAEGQAIQMGHMKIANMISRKVMHS